MFGFIKDTGSPFKGLSYVPGIDEEWGFIKGAWFLIVSPGRSFLREQLAVRGESPDGAVGIQGSGVSGLQAVAGKGTGMISSISCHPPRAAVILDNHPPLPIPLPYPVKSTDASKISRTGGAGEKNILLPLPLMGIIIFDAVFQHKGPPLPASLLHIHQLVTAALKSCRGGEDRFHLQTGNFRGVSWEFKRAP